MDWLYGMGPAVLLLLVYAGVFEVLRELWPEDRGAPRLRRDSWVDLTYWLVGPLLYGPVLVGLFAVGLFLVFGGDEEAMQAFLRSGGPVVGQWPLWAQALGALVVMDVVMYWTHRAFHTALLWRFHAIHHSPTRLDWLHTARFHPVNAVFHTVLATCVALWLGFSPAALALLTPFFSFYGAFVHANLSWTFGPFRYVLASPVFHRWHHAIPGEQGTVNYAPTFPVLDVVFGTFHMPRGVHPGPLGITGNPVPIGLVGQLVYPFHRPAAVSDDVLPTPARTG